MFDARALLSRFRLPRDPVAFVVFVAPILLYFALRDDLNPINGHMGDDGRDYLAWIRVYDAAFVQHTVSRYSMTRVLPIAAVHTWMKWRDIPFQPPETLRVFQRMNVVLVIVAMQAFIATLRRMRVSLEGRMLGAVLALTSYAMAKSPLFYPAMTDTWALTIGALMMYFTVARAPFRLALCVVAGAFSWPYLLALTGVFLLAFMPRRHTVDVWTATHGATTPEPRLGAVAWVVTLVVTLSVAGLLLAAMRYRFPDEYAWVPVGQTGVDFFARYREYDPVLWRKAIPLSSAFIVATCIAQTAALLSGITIREILSRLRVGWLLIGALSVTAASTYEDRWSSARAFTEPPFRKLVVQFALAMQRPAQSLIGHFAFFGVATVFFVLYFGRFASVARRIGPGYVGAALLGLTLLLASESRQEVPIFLVLLAPLVKAIDLEEIRERTMAYAVVVGLGASKIWYDARWVGDIRHATGTFLDFPQQVYFMHHGPAMGATSFAWHGVTAALALVLGLAVTRVRRRTS
jgi:hypothetical protein